MNKFLAILCISCFLFMAGLASFFGTAIPDHMTIGKFISISFFVVYEIMCVCGFIYFWMKKDV